MKLVDLSDECYVHLVENTVYLYVKNEFKETLYIDNIEYCDDPIPDIIREIELSSRVSMCESVQLL